MHVASLELHIATDMNVQQHWLVWFCHDHAQACRDLNGMSHEVDHDGMVQGRMLYALSSDLASGLNTAQTGCTAQK